VADPVAKADDQRLAEHHGWHLASRMPEPRLLDVKNMASQQHDRAQFVVRNGQHRPPCFACLPRHVHAPGRVVVEGNDQQRVPRAHSFHLLGSHLPQVIDQMRALARYRKTEERVGPDPEGPRAAEI
jgi:hypothetical protein